MDRSLRVLIVDESDEDTIGLVREMQRGGYHPIFRQVVEDDAVAAALEERSWDVAIADYSMPRFRAAPLLRLIEKEGRDLPVIVVSSDFGEDVAVAAMKAGAHDYLRKADLPRLVPTIERALREAEEHRTRRAAEEALRRAEARYRDLVERVHAIVWRAEPGNLRFSFVSPGAERILGYPAQRWMEPDFWREHIHHEDRERVIALLRTAGREACDQHVEYRMVGVDDRVVWLQDAVRVVVEEGEVRELLGVMVDVTRRKLLEEQLRHSQKMDAFGQLAGGVAHDFNNLLGVIMGYAEMLLKDLPPDDRRRTRAEAIEKAADRGASLTRQLLAFSRKQVLEPKVLDINVEMAELQKMLQRLIGEETEILTKLGTPLGRVSADPGQLQQVVMNLAVNARDAMPRGGKLIIETANAELDEPYTTFHPGVRPGPYVVLMVSDTGSGMDTRTVSRVFEPFFTTKEPGKGTGLGLSMVYGIVQQSGGYIAVYSEPGRGTTFKIYLPRIEAPVPSADSAPRPAEDAPGGSETLLLAEDEDALRLIIRDILEEGGYTVLEAAAPQRALEITRAHPGPIHLLVTDVIMPGMNGREMAAAILVLRPRTPVLYLSGYPDSIVAHYDLLAPGTHFLQKPFSSRILLRKVRETLDSPS